MAQETKTEPEKTDIGVIAVTEQYLRDRLYEIRGCKVFIC